MTQALYLESLEPGQSWTSPGRTITETDIVSFAGLTGDFDPLHVDHEVASESAYGRPIAHGLLGLSYLAGLSTNYPRVKTIAFVKIQDWQFVKPVYIGDTVHAVTEVESITPRGRKSGEVQWYRRLVNQKGETVQEGRLITLVSAESFLPRKKREPEELTVSPQSTETKLEKLREVAADRLQS